MPGISPNSRIGKIYGYLTVISFIEVGRCKFDYLCNCICGNTITLDKTTLLNRGRSKSRLSCGCIKLQIKNIIPKDQPWQKQYSVWTSVIRTNNKIKKENKKISIELTIEQFIKISEQNCHYCNGLPKSPLRKDNTIMKNGIDRVDSNIGYLESNCVPCCQTCNYAKNNLSLQEFLQWVDRIGNYQLNK